MKLKPIAIVCSSLIFSSVTFADINPVEKALSVEGAQVTLPVQAAKGAFSPEFIDAARQNLSNFHWQMGGDHALYYNMHMSEFVPTAVSSPAEEYKPLARNIQHQLDNLLVQTDSKGELTMAEYLADPQFRTQGFVLIHEGKLVYEAYPGMKPTDRHIWASAAKTTVGTVIAMMVEEGKVDPQAPITNYVPELKGTVWDKISVLNVLNHATGLDNEETAESIMNPDSAVVRFFAAAFGSPRYATGELEGWLDVAKDTKEVDDENAGERFSYASMNTMVLTQLIENIEGETWAKVFEDRVWSKVTARQPMLTNLTPDGMAISVGLMSSTMEDMARWGALFTPSWSAVATEPVVSQAVIDRIHQGGDAKAYIGTTKEASSQHAFNEKAQYNSYQFDYIFDDGAMAKSGNLGQFIYIDPARDFVGVMYSNNPYHSGFGENKGPALMRAAAKALADK
ncbi:serine hydrolase domain-containing protein [Enterovibrio sp. FF113]|uniref:serine hydrolase domain-containing protein n=1 Tax=Enterovibrio sp. FF113 TaxID=3230010 RepID=UPI00352F42D7